MICPHCAQNVLRRERSGMTCGKCRRPFLFDPTGNSLALHDVKVRTLAGKLSEEGRYRYTTTQLWYAAARKTLKQAEVRRLRLAAVVLLSIVATVVSIAALNSKQPFAVLPLALVLWAVVAVLIVRRVRGLPRHRVAVRLPLDEFRRTAVGAWAQLYGQPPFGLVEEHRVPIAGPPPHPALILLCHDRSVLACLCANNVPAGLEIAVNVDPHQFPRVPVAILHDVTVEGLRWAAATRVAALGRPFVDITPKPAVLMKRPHAIRLRGEPPPDAEIDHLRRTGTLSAAELAWLAGGWSAPIAALTPAELIGRVTRAVSRAPSRDPERRAAAAVGFLSWPA